MAGKVGFGIIGTGVIAEMHAQAIGMVPEAYLVGVYDKIAERSEAFARKYGVKAYATFEELLADKAARAVTIATPTGFHGAVAIPAANAGKHILCEKPLDVTTEKADAIIGACEKNKVKLASVFQSRFLRNARTIKRAVDAGRFGKIVLAGAQIKWYRSNEYYASAGWRGTWALDGGGILMNQAIHTLDLLLYAVGDVKEVFAYADTLTHKIEVEDTAVATLRFKNGALGVIEASTSCAPGFPRRMEISGEKGSVVLEDDAIVRWKFTDETPEDQEIQRNGAAGEGVKGGASDPKAINCEGHRRQIDDLVRAIQSDADPEMPGREGRRAVELICAIYESAKTGKIVPVKGMDGFRP